MIREGLMSPSFGGKGAMAEDEFLFILKTVCRARTPEELASATHDGLTAILPKYSHKRELKRLIAQATSICAGLTMQEVHKGIPQCESLLHSARYFCDINPIDILLDEYNQIVAIASIVVIVLACSFMFI